MKFLHLADLHIGKRVHEFSMLEDQMYVLDQICAMAQQYQVDAVLIAGDVYDKAVPVCEAVGLFDSFLTSLNNLGVQVLLISGNHDSPERLDFAGRLLEKQGVSVAGVFRSPLPHIILQDAYGPVHFYLFPFIKPAAASSQFELEEHTSQCAVRTVLQQENIPQKERTVLLAHQFVTAGGSLPQQSESEINPVGGLDSVDAALYDRFDYVALGHLHRPQKIGRSTVRYAGSPLKYSFSEAPYPKSVPLVTMRKKGDIEVDLLPLTPLHEMRELRGLLEDVTADTAAQMGERDDYLHITLTDPDEIFDAVGTLTRVYPNLMKLDFDNVRTQAPEVEAQIQEEKRSTFDEFSEFFEQVNGKPMSELQCQWIQQLCRKEETDETN